MARTIEEVEQEYDFRKKELEEEYKKRTDNGMEHAAAEKWLVSKLDKARKDYEKESIKILRYESKKQKILKKMKPIFDKFKRFKEQFE